jgi:hypothetical protein
MDQELIEAFRQLKKRDVDTFPSVVVSVDKEQGTCTIAVDDLELRDVQLSSVIDGNSKKFYLFPKVGSSVLVSPINEDLHRLYVEAYSEVESLDLVIDKVQFQIDKDGFLLKKENETLKALMVDLIEEIKKMKFTTNNGPTITLINTPQFTAIGDRFKNFLKDS